MVSGRGLLRALGTVLLAVAALPPAAPAAKVRTGEWVTRGSFAVDAAFRVERAGDGRYRITGVVAEDDDCPLGQETPARFLPPATVDARGRVRGAAISGTLSGGGGRIAFPTDCSGRVTADVERRPEVAPAGLWTGTDPDGFELSYVVDPGGRTARDFRASDVACPDGFVYRNVHDPTVHVIGTDNSARFGPHVREDLGWSVQSRASFAADGTGTGFWYILQSNRGPGRVCANFPGSTFDLRRTGPAPGTGPVVEPKPAPARPYGGPPAPTAAAGCTAEVKTGPIEARAACFRTRGDERVSNGRVRLNGIDLTPSRPGVAIAIDARTRAVTSTGPVEMRIGPLAMRRERLDWQRPDRVFRIRGKAAPSDPEPTFDTLGQELFGLPVGGSAKLRLDGGKTLLTVTVSVPDDVSLRVLRGLAGASGELTAAATNERGLVLDGAKVTFPSMSFGFVDVQEAELGIAAAERGHRIDGKAIVYPFRFNLTGFAGEAGFGTRDGYAKLAIALENLNRPLVQGFFLQRVGLGLQLGPFGMSGSVGATFGPQIDLGGERRSVARLDGSLSYLAGASGKPGSVELAGALKLVEADSAGAKVTVGTAGGVDLEGDLSLTVAGYGLTGALRGWVDGMRAFNVEGGAQIALPGPDGAGDAVLSARGVGACRTGFGPDVGFGYRWGRGVRGLTFAATGCSLGRWRVARARASQAGPATVLVRRGLRQLALRVRGAGGAPRVAIVAPDGRRIEPSAEPDGQVLDERTLFVLDPDTRAAYLVVDDPTPGRWRIEPLPGGPAVIGTATADPLPRLRVRASVRGNRLAYRVAGAAGRSVRFFEVAGSRRRAIGRARGRTGRLRFTPRPGPRRRRIEAVATLGGIPSGGARTVARFRAEVRPPAPRRVRIRRRGSDRIVTWGGPRRLRYEVAVRVGDGRRLRLVAIGRRSVRVGVVPPGVRLRATVRARDAAGTRGPAASGRG